ncbi:hypothetical protein RJZ56_005203 [Blastomyces dermatitidis]|uniref:Uncharacterized protein n=3 Tax=Blastomyces TaxID=229219 RepID=A0A179UQH8_BLAGS|nr:uncharacterized protein BDBG_05810 [Blastomyces gilchristii SLH14081]XP_045277241.1 uncharacterized protein BDCG_05647 [Blastomyces dermatitidis ER-3]EEQ90527.1 hypothetical protein BDCG_05647 [Blastomyces dermatitidis ER-3]OAT10130.1 hypothetical protein BDBG_05810 [Blastomyces gilchristii SLH14081]
MAEKTTMKMKWDHATEAKLFRQIIKKAKLGKKDHEELAKVMGCTPRAIREHIIWMQKAAPKEESDDAGSPSPVKRAKTTSEKRTPASEKVGSKKRKNTSDDDENDLLDNSPLKKVKAEGLD